ncbi:hypothetical protein Q9L58_008576 [Maublancomyces gigas]|uniref:RBR-type E3 ubiquitin transferase n=1 Tax=Discina gigas TaxID=1032678 RepID=A0ABR3G994_9PEZI
MLLTSDDLLSFPDERSQELGTIAAIYPELLLTSPFSATISLPVSPILPVPVSFDTAEFFPISHFPALTLQFDLPSTYPEHSPPEISLSTSPAWIPAEALKRLKTEIDSLWEDFGGGQVVFTAIDHVQQAAEHGFGFVRPDSNGGAWLNLPAELRLHIADFNACTKKQQFEQGTYECGICLEPKKGTQCHRLRSCTHVFCLLCLSSYYSSMITEGHISSVVCSDPACVKKATLLNNATAPPTPPGTPPAEGIPSVSHKIMLPPTLPPDELKDIGLNAALLKRYVELKQKAALEKDPATVYCPRQWCQAPSRDSIKILNAAMAENHTSYYLSDYGSEAVVAAAAAAAVTPTPTRSGNRTRNDTPDTPEPPKLQICSRCTFAFCRVCAQGWHGDFQICRSSNAEPTPAELASEAYLREHTTPCPQCTSPVLKSHGCNHMICKCQTHFCFLCSSYLPPGEPFKHYNTRGTGCYMRLWEGEGGDGEHVRMIREGRVDLIGEELPPPEAPDAPDAPAPRRNARREVENLLPFVVGVVPVPGIPRRVPVRGRFADWGGTDDEGDTEGEELGVDFDDVPDT